MAPHLNQQGHSAQLENQTSAQHGGLRCVPLPVVPHKGVSARLSSTTPRSSRARWNLLLAVAMLILALAGCKDPNVIENAQRRGRIQGEIDGRRTGDAEGYKSTYQPAMDAAYKAKVVVLFDTDNYKRKRTYTVIVLVSAFLLGFGLQYIVLYVLRRKEFLLDIDRIVLPKHKTQVNLTELLAPQVPDDTLALKQPNVSSSDSTHG